MNKKILNIIASLILLLSFFMPWIRAFGLGGSPYQMLTQLFKNLKFVDRNPEMLFSLLFLIFPVCALIIFFCYLKNEIKKGQIGLLHFAKKTPLIFLIAAIIYGAVNLGDGAERFIEILPDVVGMGLILTIISAIILFVDQPKVWALKTATDTQNNNTTILKDEKEKANTDDLFN